MFILWGFKHLKNPTLTCAFSISFFIKGVFSIEKNFLLENKWGGVEWGVEVEGWWVLGCQGGEETMNLKRHSRNLFSLLPLGKLFSSFLWNIVFRDFQNILSNQNIEKLENIPNIP